MSGDQVISLFAEHGEDWAWDFRDVLSEKYESIVQLEGLRAKIRQHRESIAAIGELKENKAFMASLEESRGFAGRLVRELELLIDAGDHLEAALDSPDDLQWVLDEKIQRAGNLEALATQLENFRGTYPLELIVQAQPHIQRLHEEQLAWIGEIATGQGDETLPEALRGRDVWEAMPFRLAVGRFAAMVLPYWEATIFGRLSGSRSSMAALMAVETKELHAFNKWYEKGPVDFGSNSVGAALPLGLAETKKATFQTNFAEWFHSYWQTVQSDVEDTWTESETGEEAAGAYQDTNTFERGEMGRHANAQGRAVGDDERAAHERHEGTGGLFGEESETLTRVDDFKAARKELGGFRGMTLEEARAQVRGECGTLQGVARARVQSYQRFLKDADWYEGMLGNGDIEDLLVEFRATSRQAAKLLGQAKAAESYAELLAVRRAAQKLEAAIEGSFQKTKRWRQRTVAQMKKYIAAGNLIIFLGDIAIAGLAKLTGPFAPLVNGAWGMLKESSNQAIVDGTLQPGVIFQKGAESAASSAIKGWMKGKWPYVPTGDNPVKLAVGEAGYHWIVDTAAKSLASFTTTMGFDLTSGESPADAFHAALDASAGKVRDQFTPEALMSAVAKAGLGRVVQARMEGELSDLERSFNHDTARMREAVGRLMGATRPEK